MFEAVLREPSGSLQSIYEEIRSRFTAKMDSNMKLLFLQELPCLEVIKQEMLKRRRKLIPPDPKTATEIDVENQVFIYKDGENCVKGDQVFSDGRRIIFFSTNDHLHLLARSPQVLADATFSVTPRIWSQTFIISCEVSSGVFVPVAYCLLPDKTKESYLAMLVLITMLENILSICIFVMAV